MTNVDIRGRNMHVDDLSKLNNIFSNIFACSFGNSMNLHVVFSCILFHVIYLGYRRSKIFVEDVDICSYLDTLSLSSIFIFFFERRQFCILKSKDSFNSSNYPQIARFSYNSSSVFLRILFRTIQALLSFPLLLTLRESASPTWLEVPRASFSNSQSQKKISSTP